MANQSADKSTSGDKAVTGALDVKVNAEPKSLAAFQLIDILGSLVFQFGDASSTTGVVSTKFPKNEVGNELQHGAAGVDVSYSVDDKPVSWEGGKIKVAAKLVAVTKALFKQLVRRVQAGRYPMGNSRSETNKLRFSIFNQLYRLEWFQAGGIIVSLRGVNHGR
uniref:hypothetical protein n=1 Tax=Pseudomonas sp. Z003-0.4C(8344-21) TaxID=1855380 RepID=UPI000B8513BA|nr:hypothetical protein [Pseudomonas sp. Z003-0.4C(8344-21)]